MRLERLELLGFKSFAQKTVLEFPSGITCVVGPNGSGKSNIIDAIRWLLGEREAKNIRGDKAEDLIFAGTSERPRMGLAHASLIFDNRDKFFPLEFVEVVVERRVNRDGVSEYLLNEEPVRLKDIIELFAKSRLGTKGFTIINQGDSDLFIRSSPEERRAMLEEMLGLREFQIKKHDALNKLKATRTNLDKVRALIQEIAPHLRMLKRQTAKWERHDEFAAELRELEAQYFGVKLRELDEEMKPIAPALAALDGEAGRAAKELALLEEALGRVKRGEPESDGELRTIRETRNALLARRAGFEKDVGRIEAKLEFVLRRPRKVSDGAEAEALLLEVKFVLKGMRAAEDISVMKSLTEKLWKRVEAFFSDRGEEKEGKERELLEREKKDLMESLRALDGELRKLEMSEQGFADKLREFNEKFRRAYEAVEEKRRSMNALEAKKGALRFQEERIVLRREDLRGQAHQVGRRLEEFAVFGGDRGAVDLILIERRMLRLRGELASIGEVDEAVVREAKEVEARHEFLSGQLADLEKSTKGLQVLIKELDEKIHTQFKESLQAINEEFSKYFRMMFGGGRARLILEKPREVQKEEGRAAEGETPVSSLEKEPEDAFHPVDHGGILIEVAIPRKRITGLDMLSGGEKSLVSVAALFALISVSPPPFLVLDEADAALDEQNTRRFASLVKEFSKKTQFIIVTHNRATMEAADVLYGVTMKEDGTSRILSLEFKDADASPAE